MPRDYIPKNNSQFMDFQRNLNSQVAANATAWNIPSSEATALSDWSTGYELVYKPIVNKRTRTQEQVIAHDEYRNDYVAFLRPFVQGFLVNNTLIPISERAAMGLNPRGLKPRSERPTITTAPIPSLKAVGGGMVRFTFKTADSNTRIARHPDSNGVEVYYRLEPLYMEPRPLNDTLIEDDEQVIIKDNKTGYLQRFSTRAQFLQELGVDAIGKRLKVYGRWVNTSDSSKSGPYSAITSMVVS